MVCNWKIVSDEGSPIVRAVCTRCGANAEIMRIMLHQHYRGRVSRWLATSMAPCVGQTQREPLATTGRIYCPGEDGVVGDGVVGDGVFVRCLWGNENVRGYRRACNDVRETVRAETFELERGLVMYCAVGRENADYLASLRLDVFCLAQNSLPCWPGSPSIVAEDLCHAGWVRWGLSLCHAKFQSIRRAVALYSHAVWLDWDTRFIAPLPADFWPSLASGNRYRASLRRYKRRQIFSRRGAAAHLKPSGAWQYFRGDLIHQLIAFHLAHCPRAKDEETVSRFFDSPFRGWMGEATWKAVHEPSCYDQRKPNRQVFPIDPASALFINVGRN